MAANKLHHLKMASESVEGDVSPNGRGVPINASTNVRTPLIRHNYSTLNLEVGEMSLIIRAN